MYRCALAIPFITLYSTRPFQQLTAFLLIAIYNTAVSVLRRRVAVFKKAPGIIRKHSCHTVPAETIPAVQCHPASLGIGVSKSQHSQSPNSLLLEAHSCQSPITFQPRAPSSLLFTSHHQQTTISSLPLSLLQKCFILLHHQQPIPKAAVVF